MRYQPVNSEFVYVQIFCDLFKSQQLFRHMIEAAAYAVGNFSVGNRAKRSALCMDATSVGQCSAYSSRLWGSAFSHLNNCIATDRGILDNEFGTRSCRYRTFTVLKVFVVEKKFYRHPNPSHKIKTVVRNSL